MFKALLLVLAMLMQHKMLRGIKERAEGETN